MNKNNIIIIKIILFLTILFSIFLIYYLREKKIESFFDGKEYILKDCENNWANNFNKRINDCKKATWVKNPTYLCGVCDKNINKNLSMLKAGNKTYFGCDNVNATNSYGLQWMKDASLGTYTKLGDFATDLLTCNTFNSDVKSGMYVFLCCDDNGSFTINGQTISKNEGFFTMGMYYIENVKYGDIVNLSFHNVYGPGGFNVSYIWNKQLFIMDENGYENVANIINYTVSGNTGWNERKASYITNDVLPPWMYNWRTIEGCGASCDTYGSMSFKVGDTINKSSLNGDLQGWIGIDDTVSVYINDDLKYTQSNSTIWQGTFNYIGTLGKFTVPNVEENSIIKLVGYNGGGPAGLGFTYLWNGLIFCLPSTLANFNSCSLQMNYETQNEQGGMTYGNGGTKNFPWEKNWLNFSSNVGNFQLTTTITPSENLQKWIYPPTINTYYTIPKSTLVGNWSTTNIKNSASMSISFWIIISETNPDWRSIFHVSNQNVNCCNSGNRIPAMWIWPNNTGFAISNSTSTDGNNYPQPNYKVPLNTAVFLTLVFNSTTLTLYANAISQQVFTYSSPLVSATKDASFYMGDPWYSTFGGFKIKNFALYNNVFNSSEVMNLYMKEMTVSDR
jgi:hypothetical protein